MENMIVATNMVIKETKTQNKLDVDKYMMLILIVMTKCLI